MDGAVLQRAVGPGLLEVAFEQRLIVNEVMVGVIGGSWEENIPGAGIQARTEQATLRQGRG